mmetsp:Transcript_105943/g.274133  ORF Transcript_105943/g.274133 Transcript_105943/m.274133 type:complete len:211 (-) Transcript_105943:103-735(-)
MRVVSAGLSQSGLRSVHPVAQGCVCPHELLSLCASIEQADLLGALDFRLPLKGLLRHFQARPGGLRSIPCFLRTHLRVHAVPQRLRVCSQLGVRGVGLLDPCLHLLELKSLRTKEALKTALLLKKSGKAIANRMAAGDFQSVCGHLSIVYISLVLQIHEVHHDRGGKRRAFDGASFGSCPREMRPPIGVSFRHRARRSHHGGGCKCPPLP